MNAFEQIVLIIQGDLYRIAKIRLGNDEDVNDAIQNTILKAFRYLNRLKSNVYFNTWIIRILINECNSIIRKNVRNDNLIRKISKVECEDEFLYEDFKSLEDILNGFSSEELLILNLHYRDNYSFKEIAYVLKKNSNTVKSKFFRMKEKIRRNIDGMEDEYGEKSKR